MHKAAQLSVTGCLKKKQPKKPKQKSPPPNFQQKYSCYDSASFQEPVGISCIAHSLKTNSEEIP